MPASISIAIANSIICEGLRRIFTDAGFQVTECVSTLKELDLPAHAICNPHILVVERDLLKAHCTQVIQDIRQVHANLRVVVLTGTFDFDEMVALYAAGAYAYFPDQVPYLSLVAVLQMVAGGQKVAPPEVIDFLISLPASSRRSTPSPTLDAYGFRDRELRVLELLALGQPNKSIAREMAVNEASVKAAVKAILRKLGVENRTQAAVMAREMLALNDGDGQTADPSQPSLPGMISGKASLMRGSRQPANHFPEEPSVPAESLCTDTVKLKSAQRHISLQKLINRTSAYLFCFQIFQMAGFS